MEHSTVKSIEYPSADFPAPPRVRVEVPEDWDEPLPVAPLLENYRRNRRKAVQQLTDELALRLQPTGH